MKFELTQLPYEKSALAPDISEKTIEFHHGKHHQKYVDTLNSLIEGTEHEEKSLEEIIKTSDGKIFNNAAQVWNHTFYFNSFSDNPATEPEGQLLEEIDKQFGSFTEFREKFNASAAGLFGSGWTWLVKTKEGSLQIVNKGNAGNPITDDQTPILTCDVWEHAYYLDYQNKRPEYLEKFWNVVDWKKVSERY